MILPGHLLVGAIAASLVVLVLTLDEETRRSPRRHLVVIGGALFAFGAVFRLFDVLQHIEQPRWSAAVGAVGLFCYLFAESPLADRLLGRGRYTGPDRRQQPRDTEE